MIVKHFDEKVQTLFVETIASLPPMDMWSVERNVYSFQGKAEADLLIKKGGINYAIVEVKSSISPNTFEDANRQARFIALLFFTPFYIVVTPNKFALYQADGKLLELRKDPLSEIGIISLLTRQTKHEFDKKKWNENIEAVNREVEESTDEDIQKANIQKVLESLKNSDNYTINEATKKIILTPETEQNLFDALLGKYKKEEVCRFTTLNSIFRTINTKKQSMSSIVAMNDKSETSYVSEYFKQTAYELLSSLQSGPTDWNSSFITSCCDIDRENDFTMLRLYADDAKGVCIRYKILSMLAYPGFILRKVSYQRQDGSHPELDIIIKLLQINVYGFTLTLPSLSIWQHFFKPKEYEFEKEVRLLYRIDKEGIQPKETFWILNDEFNIVCPLVNFEVTKGNNTYPMEIAGITLGPKMREADINRQQLETLLHSGPILNGPNVHLTLSDVNHYR